jgi:ribosomal protein S18 acetylase RimI-like enzyme
MTDVFRPLRELDDPLHYLPDTAPWVYQANKPYLDWLFGGEAAAQRIVDLWMRRDSSEISIRNISLLFRDGVVLGGMVMLEGKKLVSARKADTLAIARDVPAQERPAVLQRLKQVGHLFVYPADDEFYLAKMGVLPAARGTGVGRLIFGLSIEVGAALGYKRFRGDVHCDNIPALRLYESFGFKIVARNRSETSDLEYVSVFLDRSAA